MSRLAFTELASSLTLALVLNAEPALAARLIVLDPEAKPVAGAQVNVFTVGAAEDLWNELAPPTLSAATDATGTFPHELPYLAELEVMVGHPDFEPWRGSLSGLEPRTLHLRPGQRLSGTVTAEPPPSRFEGEACAYWSTGLERRGFREWSRCAPLTDDGRFELRGLADSPVEISIEARGFLPKSGAAKPGKPLTLRLDPGVPVAGRVVEEGSETGIAAARVSSRGALTVETDREGYFAMAVPALPAEIEAKREGFRSGSAKTTPSPEPKALTIRLRPGEQVTGQLIAPQGESPKELRAEIELHDQPGRRALHKRSVIPEPDGRFVIDLPGPGRVALRLQATGFRPHRLPSFEVGPLERHELGIIGLTVGASLAARLVEESTAAPLPGTTCQLHLSALAQFESALRGRGAAVVADPEGQVRWAGLESGAYELRCERQGLATTAVAVELRQDEALDLGDLPMGAGTKIGGTVLDRRGTARPALRLKLFLATSQALEPVQEVSSRSAGLFSFERVAPGPYRLEVWGSHRLLNQEVEVSRDEAKRELELVVPGGLVSGVVERGGLPVKGGLLIFSPAFDPEARQGKLFVNSASSGRRFGLGLPSAELRAEVSEAGLFEIEDLPPGQAPVRYISPAGLEAASELSITDEPEQSVVLGLPALSLEGRVSDDESDQGLAAVRLTAFSAGGAIRGRAETRSDGTFELRQLGEEELTLVAEAKGYSSASLVVVPEDGGPPLALALRPTSEATLVLNLRRSDSAPASGALATLVAPPGRVLASVPLDGSGFRRFTQLAPGPLHLLWTDPLDGTGVFGPLELDAGTTRELDHRLPQAGVLTLVCEETGCAGAALELLTLKTEAGFDLATYLPRVLAGSRLSMEGRLHLGRVAPGRYQLGVRLGGRSWQRSIEVKAGTPLEVRF